MFNSSIKINPNCKCMSFNGIDKAEPKTQSMGKSNSVDSFEKKEEVKAPIISSFRAFAGLYTDEQVAQINKSKKLPDNLRFVYIDPMLWKNGQVWREPYYRISVYNIHNPITKNGTTDLPEGYEVRKSHINGTSAVKK